MGFYIHFFLMQTGYKFCSKQVWIRQHLIHAERGITFHEKQS